MILKLLYIIYSESAKITLSVCVAVGKFVCDVNGGKFVLYFFVYDLHTWIERGTVRVKCLVGFVSDHTNSIFQSDKHCVIKLSMQSFELALENI